MDSFKTSIVLGIIVAALGVTLGLNQAFRTEYTEQGNIVLFDFKKDQVTRLKVSFPAREGRQAVEASRTAEGWKLEKPVAADANGGTIDRIASYMGMLAADQEWSESDTEIAGFAQEEVVIEATMNDGKVHTAWLGRLSGTGLRGYARVSTRRGIFSVSKAIWDSADRDLLEYRSRELFTVDYFDIEMFRLERAGTSWHLEKAGEQWVMHSPYPDTGDEVGLYDFLSNLHKIQAFHFVTESASEGDLAQWGLDRPEAVVRLRGRGTTSTVSLGRVEKDGRERWFAIRHDRPFVAEVDPQTASMVKIEDPYRFRGRSVMPDPSSWQPVELNVSGNVGGRRIGFAAIKRQFRWMITQPHEREPDPSPDGLWGKFLESLTTLSVEEFVSENVQGADLEKYGLGPSAVTITVEFTEGGAENVGGRRRTVQVALGKLLPAEGLCYARVMGRPNVVAVLDGLKKSLSQGYVRFLNRDLVPLRLELIQWMEFRFKGTTVRWERKGENRWVVTEPKKGGVGEPMRVKAALGLGLTKAQGYVRDVSGPEVLKEYGLDSPNAILRVGQLANYQAGARVVTTELHMGAFKTAQSMYARYKQGDFAQGDLIFLLGRSSYDVLLELWAEALK